jgi:hypothetical protein
LIFERSPRRKNEKKMQVGQKTWIKTVKKSRNHKKKSLLDKFFSEGIIYICSPTFRAQPTSPGHASGGTKKRERLASFKGG